MGYLNVDMSEDQPRKGFVNFSYETIEHNKNPLIKFQRYFVTYTSKVTSTAVLFNQSSKSSYGFFLFEPHQQSSFGIISKQLSSISILLRDIFRRQNANKLHPILWRHSLDMSNFSVKIFLLFCIFIWLNNRKDIPVAKWMRKLSNTLSPFQYSLSLKNAQVQP